MLAGVVEVLLASLTLACLLIVVGVAARVLLGSRLDLPRSVAVSAGIGASVISVVVALSYRLTGTSVTVLRVLVVASTVVVVLGAARAVRRSADRRALLRGWAAHVANPADALGAALAVLLMARLLPLGLTFWTSGPNDWHRYVASVQVWLSGEAGEPDFSAVHGGDFRDTQLDRALSEKPLVTALLLAATRTIGVADFRLLTPITLVLLWIAFACVGHLLRRIVRTTPVVMMAVIAATTASLLPMWPAYAAQVGHIAVVALATTWLTVLARAEGSRVVHVLVAGIVLAATAGSNVSLVGGAVLVLVTLAVWAQVRTDPGRGWRPALVDVVGSGAVAGVLLLPFLSWFAYAVSVQGAGTEGSIIPLASPFGFIGLQTGLLASAPLSRAVILWVVTVIVLLVVVRPNAAWVRAHAAGAAVGAAAFLTLLGFALVYGPNNYVVAKTTMLVIALTMPFGLALAVAALGSRLRARTVTAALVLVAVAATLLTLHSSRTAVLDARPGLGALREDERLAALDLVTIDIDDYPANSLASVIVPAGRIVMARATYAHADPPEGDLFVTTRRQAVASGSTIVADLGDRYVLARRDLSLGTGVLEVGIDAAAAQHLYGFWRNEPGRYIWTTATVNWFVGDLEPALVGDDLVVTFTGITIEDDDPVRTIEATVGGVPVGTVTVAAGEEVELVARVPASAVDGDGRLLVRLESAGPSHPWNVATPEYSLATVVVRAG